MRNALGENTLASDLKSRLVTSAIIPRLIAPGKMRSSEPTRKFVLKWILLLLLLASLPLLSGCLTACAISSANESVRSTLYTSADKIDSAGITSDNRLYVFFEKNSTHPARTSRFTLEIPVTMIASDKLTFQDFWRGYGKLPGEDEHAPFVGLNIPGGMIRPNWTPMRTLKNELKPVPIGPTLIRHAPSDFYHYQDFALLSNATQTIYLTATNQIEFVYVDAALQPPLNLVRVEPTVITRKQPGYYAALPVTIPADIATSPLQGLALLYVLIFFRHMC